jgi:hypothetical protein
VALILVGGTTAYFLITTAAAQQESDREEGYRNLDDAIALVQEADAVVVALDQAIDSQVTEENLAQLQALLDQSRTIEETLTNASQHADQALQFFSQTGDQALAQHVIDAADYRSDMLNYGRMIVQNDISAMQGALLLADAWYLITSADYNMRHAVEVVGGANASKIQEAVDSNKAAAEELAQAQMKIQEAQGVFDQADFSSIANFLVVKREAALLAIESDEALLAKDVTLATQKNDEYTSKDAEVVQAAQKIPSDPMSLITDAYDAATKDIIASYQLARGKAADSDGFVREYTGVDVLPSTQ